MHEISPCLGLQTLSRFALCDKLIFRSINQAVFESCSDAEWISLYSYPINKLGQHLTSRCCLLMLLPLCPVSINMQMSDWVLADFDLSMCILCPRQVWAVSGEPRGSSGGRKESIPLKWVMQEDIPQTLPTRRCAQVSLSSLVFKDQEWTPELWMTMKWVTAVIEEIWAWLYILNCTEIYEIYGCPSHCCLLIINESVCEQIFCSH